MPFFGDGDHLRGRTLFRFIVIWYNVKLLCYLLDFDLAKISAEAVREIDSHKPYYANIRYLESLKRQLNIDRSYAFYLKMYIITRTHIRFPLPSNII